MYAYHDARGYLARGPSLRQWRHLRAALTGPEGMAFAASGITHNPAALAVELDTHTTAQAVRLRRAADRAQELLVISDGVRQL